MYVVICRYCIEYQSKWKNSLRSALSQKPRKREWGCEVARPTEPRFTEAGYHVGHATRLRQYNSAVMIQRYSKHQGRSHKLIQWHFREEKSSHIAQRNTKENLDNDDYISYTHVPCSRFRVILKSLKYRSLWCLMFISRHGPTESILRSLIRRKVHSSARWKSQHTEGCHQETTDGCRWYNKRLWCVCDGILC